MAVLYVTEYATVSLLSGARQAQVPQEPPLASQAIAITAGSTQTAAFNAKTKLIRIHNDATAAAAVEIGANPTATVPGAGLGSQRFAANQTEYKDVSLLPLGKVAVIATT